MTNKEDEALLSQPDFLIRAAKALLTGIAAYFEEAPVNSTREVEKIHQEGETS
ncbi:MAG: hypothetical protein KGZ96_14450 [Clostridia bacterium]|nr:hypothetical protein [Clostridia bacterium]